MAGRAFRGLWAKGEEYQPLITASWRRASSCHATTDIEDKIIPKKCYRLVLKHRERAQPLTSARGSKPGEIPQKHKCRSRGNVFKKTATVETFSRQMYVHIHTHTYTPKRESPGRTHTHTLTGIRAHARPLIHIDTGCSECGSLGLALPQACGNSPEASSAVRPLPHAKKKNNKKQKHRITTERTVLFHHPRPLRLRICIK